jgi:hypothetical protein
MKQKLWKLKKEITIIKLLPPFPILERKLVHIITGIIENKYQKGEK